MCGIAGFFSRNQRFSKSDLEAITTTLAHRGPNAAGYFFDNIVGLGHRRLSVLDLSESANQPFFSRDNRYVIVFNGEVYNFKELAQKYQLTPKTTSDTEIILELFIKLGSACISEFIGMFAFAIYDTANHNLFIARDRLGIKPIYYFFDNEQFIFASELKSIQTLFKGKLNLNKQAVNEYLHLGYIPEPLTIYIEVKKFPSGSFAEISLKNFDLKFTKYWNTENLVHEKTNTSNFIEAKNQLKTLIESSVNYRMISDVPVGTFLSGGTDSSIVTAVAQKMTPHKIKTFSIGFKEAKFNEAEHAKKVAQHLQTEHYELMLSEKDAQEQISYLINIYDEPFADSSAIPTLLVSEMARKEVTVVLSGDGGDEQFMGYNAYTWANRLQNPFIKTFRNPIYHLLQLGNNRQKRASTLFNYLSSERIQSHIFSQDQYLFSETEINQLTNSKFSTISIPNYSKLKRNLSAPEKQAYYDLNAYLKDDLLVKVDRASMQHSLEVRVPLLDHRIVEFSLNLQEQWKVNNGIQKYLLKEVLYDYIPKDIMERPKWGFSIPLIKWLQKDLAYLIDEHLSKETVETFGVVDYQFVNQLIQRFRNGEDYLYNKLWALIILHQFLKKNA